MQRLTTASIHSSESFPPLLLSPAFGGWKATLRFSLRGSCLLRASFRAFRSREKGTCDGPTELRGGKVIEPGRDGTGVGGVPVGGGEDPRGRF